MWAEKIVIACARCVSALMCMCARVCGMKRSFLCVVSMQFSFSCTQAYVHTCPCARLCASMWRVVVSVDLYFITVTMAFVHFYIECTDC